MNEIARKFRQMLTVGIASTMVVAGATGCSTEKQSAEAKWATTEANDLNKFTDAYKTQDLEEMEKIIKDTQTQLDKLKNEKDKAEKYKKDNADELENEYIMLGNELACMTYAYGQQAGVATNNAQPKSTDFFTNALGFLKGVFDGVKGLVNGNPIPKAATNAAEYAQTNPDYQLLSDSFADLYEAYAGQEFDYDAIKNGQYQTGDESNGQSDWFSTAINAAGEVGKALGTGFGNGMAAAEEANDEYNKQVRTDQYGHYIRVDEASIESAEEMQAKIDSGEIIYVEDPDDPTSFIPVVNPDYVGEQEEPDGR